MQIKTSEEIKHPGLEKSIVNLIVFKKGQIDLSQLLR